MIDCIEKEVNWDITDYRAESIYDMKRSMELTSLFGAKLNYMIV